MIFSDQYIETLIDDLKSFISCIDLTVLDNIDNRGESELMPLVKNAYSVLRSLSYGYDIGNKDEQSFAMLVSYALQLKASYVNGCSNSINPNYISIQGSLGFLYKTLSFLDLTDTPYSYSSSANRAVLVNQFGNGLIFADQPDLSVYVNKTTNQSIDGVKTFIKPVVIPNAVNTNQAVNLGQLNTLEGALVHKDGPESITGVKTFTALVTYFSNQGIFGSDVSSGSYTLVNNSLSKLALAANSSITDIRFYEPAGVNSGHVIRYESGTNLFEIGTVTGFVGTEVVSPGAIFDFKGQLRSSNVPTNSSDVVRLADLSSYSIKTNFINAKDLGIVGDGVTDDSTAINTALATYKAIYFPSGQYYIASPIIINNSQIIYGDGETTVFLLSTDITAISVTSNNSEIRDIKILGNGRGTVTAYATTRPNQNAIEISGTTLNTKLINIVTNSIGNAGIIVRAVGDGNSYAGQGATIIGGHHTNNLYGIRFDNLAEYNTSTGVKSTSNQYGVYSAGGNNSITGGNLDGNATGLKIASGLNDSHTSITGVTINHSTDYGVDIDDITNGMIFTNCSIFFSSIRLISSSYVTFDNCLLKSVNITFTSTVNAIIQNTRFINFITPTLSGTYRFFNNQYSGGVPTIMAEGTSSNFIINGATTVNGLNTINGNNVINGSDTINGNTTGSLSILKILANAANRYVLGSDAGITAGAIGDINSYVYGANNYFISTNGVKRLTVSGSGLVSIASLTASLPLKTDASKNLISGAINLSGSEVTGVLSDANVATTIARLSSPNLTGIPTAPTAILGTNTTQLATTAFVIANTAKALRLISSGTGVATTISVAHGQSGITSTSKVVADAGSSAAGGWTYVTTDATNVNFIYATAPISGTNNLIYNIYLTA